MKLKERCTNIFTSILLCDSSAWIWIRTKRRVLRMHIQLKSLACAITTQLTRGEFVCFNSCSSRRRKLCSLQEIFFRDFCRTGMNCPTSTEKHNEWIFWIFFSDHPDHSEQFIPTVISILAEKWFSSSPHDKNKEPGRIQKLKVGVKAGKQQQTLCYFTIWEEHWIICNLHLNHSLW